MPRFISLPCLVLTFRARHFLYSPLTCNFICSNTRMIFLLWNFVATCFCHWCDIVNTSLLRLGLFDLTSPVLSRLSQGQGLAPTQVWPSASGSPRCFCAEWVREWRSSSSSSPWKILSTYIHLDLFMLSTVIYWSCAISKKHKVGKCSYFSSHCSWC